MSSGVNHVIISPENRHGEAGVAARTRDSYGSRPVTPIKESFYKVLLHFHFSLLISDLS